jgi:hypothetical protein
MNAPETSKPFEVSGTYSELNATLTIDKGPDK